jgi:cytochrome c-type biogenesis protein CcmE
MTAGRNAKFLVGGAAILLALGYLIYAGVTQSAVYFITPSELERAAVAGRAYRLGGMVVPGSVHWNSASLDLDFALTDGKVRVPVRHRGTPPDLFGGGRGAVVEGTWTPDGYFKATLIMAKHSESYQAPHGDPSSAAYREMIRALQRKDAR